MSSSPGASSSSSGPVYEAGPAGSGPAGSSGPVREPGGGPWPTAETRPVVLLGWPARHSLSPVIHNAAFTAHGLDLVYLVAPCPPERLDGVVDALGTIGAVGANVTVPHKRAVLERCDVLTDEAALIGAVNTLAWTAEGLVGDNTDATGLRDDLAALVRPELGERFVVLGSGGAARAAAVAVGRLGGSLTVAARRPDAARELANLGARAGAQSAQGIDLAAVEVLADATDAARVVVNATPLGMHDEPLPEPLMGLRADQVAYDLVYDPSETPFLRAAAAAGAGAHHGLGMLVGQAAASYRRWTGRDAPLEVMVAAAQRALAARHEARDDARGDV
jgi:shikimate dehydrogenase